MINYNILCIGPHFWSDGPGGDIWRRRHHLMTNLAKRHKVVFIEPAYYSPFCFLGTIFSFFVKRSSLKKISENLWVLRLYNPLPLQETSMRVGIKIVKWFNDRACLFQIKKVLKYLNLKKNILLWAYYTPRTVFLLEKLRSDFIVCDVYDKYTEYATVDNWRKDYISKEEKVIFENSDIIFAVSKSLLNYCQKYNENCYLIPNGVDEIFFNTDLQNSGIPDDLKSIPKPCIGYVGSIFDKLDYNLLFNVLKSCKNYSFIFIGPVKLINSNKKKQFNKLKALSNTFFLGVEEIKQLPKYYKWLDVCIAPYDTSFHQVSWIDPLKALECMAMGKILITTIECVKNSEIQETLLKADTEDDFIKAINLVLNSDFSKQTAESIQFAKRNTWPIRVSEIEKIINEYWMRKNQINV